MEGVFGVNQTFYIGMYRSDCYAVHVNENGCDRAVIVNKDNLDGFIQCLKFLGYQEI